MSQALPTRFADLKRDIAGLYPNFQERATQAWAEIISELRIVTNDITKNGPNYIPKVDFQDLEALSRDKIDEIKRRGCVVVSNIVDDAEAVGWKDFLEEYIKHPNTEDSHVFFQIYWSRAQVQARSHPNFLAVSAWLNNLYHTKEQLIDGVDLSTPLTYADRFRIRHPGVPTKTLPPHIDGAATERWEEPNLRECYAHILSGDWRLHDPYALEGRLTGQTDLYNRPNQASVFRTFQGWLAMSETGPGEGTIKLFPDVLLSNAYIILRPFFRPRANIGGEALLDASSWEFDISNSEFPGILPADVGYVSPHPTTTLHPHLQLDSAMTPAPKVKPGDAVFWHCDVIHSVEEAHNGTEDSAVIYIPAVPLTPQNQSYIEKQKATFLAGERPPDFPRGTGEAEHIGVASVEDIPPHGRRAMGFY